ncbi:MAG: helix-turn-helix domain-containing protein, partial [Pseudoclavibacter sp.]
MSRLERLERGMILAGLREAEWNREAAAKALDISRAP